MYKRILNSPIIMIVISIILKVVIGFLDYITGYEFDFFAFYYIPIAISAWYVGKKWAIINSIILAIVWSGIDIVSGHKYSSWIFHLWNGVIHLISFLLLALMLFMIKSLLSKEKELTGKLQESLDNIKVLEGFLPICASCKKIKNNLGQWEQIEHYIRDNTDAEFTHTICPDCQNKLYPDIT